MRHPTGRLALLGVAAALFVAACQEPDGSDPRVLRVMLADDWASAPTVLEVVDDFEAAHPGVRVQIQATPFAQIPDRIRQSIDLGQQPDVAHWHAFAAAAAGLADPVDEAWSAAGWRTEDFLPGAVDGVTHQGQRFGVPLDVNALVLLANPTLLAQAELDAGDLATTEGFRAAAAAVTERTDAEHAIAVTGSSWAAYGWIVAGGGRVMEDQGADLPRFTFDEPATVDALQLLVDLVETGAAPPPFAPDLAVDAVAAFASGTTALHASGSWDLPTTRRAQQAGVVLPDVEVLALPQAVPEQPRTVLGGSSLFIPRGAPEPTLAFAFMDAMTRDEVALELALTEGRLPARVRVYDAPPFQAAEDLAAFVALLDTAEVMPLIAFPEVAAAFRDGLEQALSGRRSPADALADVQRVADAWLAAQEDAA